MKLSNPLFFLTAWAAQTAQTEGFQNVAYRPTVYKTGAGQRGEGTAHQWWVIIFNFPTIDTDHFSSGNSTRTILIELNCGKIFWFFSRIFYDRKPFELLSFAFLKSLKQGNKDLKMLKTLRFCHHNCSDLLWDNFVLV